MKEDAVRQVSDIIIQALKNHTNEPLLAALKNQVKALCEAYPIP